MSNPEKCVGCGSEEPGPLTPTPEGDLCPACHKNFRLRGREASGGVECDRCGMDVPKASLKTVYSTSGTTYSVCAVCVRTFTVQCGECGKLFFTIDRGVNYLQNEEKHQCLNCYADSGSFQCRYCGDHFSSFGYGAEVESEEDGVVEGSYCKDCLEAYQHRNESVQGYHDHKRVWNRFGQARDGVYYGVELEAIMDEDTDDNYEAVAKMINRKYRTFRGKEFLFTESDSSLEHPDTGEAIGYETIFHPMSFGFIRGNSDYFGQILGDMRAAGMIGYEADSRGISAGMHVTVTWSALNRDEKAKFLHLIYDNADLIKLVSRRRMENLEEYADLRPPRKIWQLARDLRARWPLSKHVAVNLKHLSKRLGGDEEVEESVKLAEVRIFRSTLKKESFLMNIEFVAACVDFSKDKRFGIRQTDKHRLLDFIKEGKRDYPHIYAWLREKGQIG